MKNLLKQLLILDFLVLSLVFLLFSSIAYADESRPKREYVETKTTALVNNLSVDTACGANPWDTETPACVYFTQKVLGYHQAELLIKFTKDTATDFYMICEGSLTGLKPWGKYQAGDASLLPTHIHMSDKLLHWDVSGWSATDTDVWRVSMSIADRSVRCRFWVTGGSTDDKASVWWTLSAP